MHVDWQGVLPALMTEFHEDGSLDLDMTRRHAELCIRAGCRGLVVLGTLGENLSLRPEEKEKVVTAVLETAEGRVPVLAGIAEYTTERAMEAAATAERAGCDGLMVLPPMVYVPDSREAVAHFAAIARAARRPIMIYNNPVAYGLDLKPDAMAELAGHGNIVALKDSSHDSRRITDMVNRCGDRFLLFCGVDDLLLENVVCGAVGWVSGVANGFPEEAVRLFELAREGRLEAARQLYRWLMPLLHLDTDRKLVQMLKLVNQLVGTGREWVRRPRLPLEGAEREHVEQLVRQALATRPLPLP